MKTKTIDWERMKNDLEGARARIIQRIKQGSLDDLRKRLAVDLGNDNAERLLPREIDKLYSENQLSLGLAKNSRAIYAVLPDVGLAYGATFPEEYDDLESSLPQLAGRLFSDIRGGVIQEAEIEGLRKGRQFISGHDRILLPFYFNHSDYRLIGEIK